MKIKPISDYILIEPIFHTQTSGGILIPEFVAKDNYREGKIIAVGPGKLLSSGKRIPMEIEIGDIVHLGIGGYDIEVDGKEFYMVREEHITLIMNRK